MSEQKSATSKFSLIFVVALAVVVGVQAWYMEGKELDNTFARAHQSLSKHHYLKALKTGIVKDIHKTGHDIKVAVYHLEHALVQCKA